MELFLADLRYALSEFGGVLVLLLLGLALVIWVTARPGAALEVIGVLMLLVSPVVGLGTPKLPLLPWLEPDGKVAVLLAFTGLLLIGFGSLVTSASAILAELRALQVDRTAPRYLNIVSDHQEAAIDELFPEGRADSMRRQLRRR